MFKRIKLLITILKAIYRPKIFSDTYYCIKEFSNCCIVFKHNPYHFNNMGNLMITKEVCKYPTLENYIFYPLPIYEQLYDIVNQ